MKRAVQYTIAFLAVIFTVTQVEAGLITLSDLQPQTTGGQDFAFTFSGVPVLSDGAGGTLKIIARGDFSDGASLFETLAFSAEGVVTGTGVRFDLTPSTVLLNTFDPNDIEFVHSVALTGGEVDTLIGDGIVTITVDFDSGVNDVSANSYASVELIYNTPGLETTPEPTSLAIFGIGALCMGAGAARRRRKEKQAAA